MSQIYILAESELTDINKKIILIILCMTRDLDSPFNSIYIIKLDRIGNAIFSILYSLYYENFECIPVKNSIAKALTLIITNGPYINTILSSWNGDILYRILYYDKYINLSVKNKIILAITENKKEYEYNNIVKEGRLHSDICRMLGSIRNNGDSAKHIFNPSNLKYDNNLLADIEERERRKNVPLSDTLYKVQDSIMKIIKEKGKEILNYSSRKRRRIITQLLQPKKIQKIDDSFNNYSNNDNNDKNINNISISNDNIINNNNISISNNNTINNDNIIHDIYFNNLDFLDQDKEIDKEFLIDFSPLSETPVPVPQTHEEEEVSRSITEDELTLKSRLTEIVNDFQKSNDINILLHHRGCEYNKKYADNLRFLDIIA